MDQDNKAKKQLPIGKSNFTDFFDKNAVCYFVDKTPFIKELVETSLFSSSANLILRPRRFGKTLALSMLQNFFDSDAKEARPIFEKLAVGKDKAFCDKYENKFPVISITFKDVKGDTMESMLDALNSNLAGEYIRHAYAADMAENALEKERYDRLLNGKGTFDDFKQYLALLSKALYLKTGIKPLVFIDEYDVPLNDAHQHGFFKEFVSIISGMFSAGLKDNLYVGGAVITGCLQIAKNQIFTGLNNPAICPVTSAKYAKYFGFTKEETAELLHYYGLDSRMDDVRDNYDGYNMGEYSIYNPFSVLNFVSDALVSPSASCKNYWASTSGNALLMEMLKSCPNETNEGLQGMFEALLTGNPVEKILVDDTIVYGTMLESNAAIMGTLLFSGYLTVVKDESGGVYTLRIPNREVLSTFRALVDQYNKSAVNSPDPELLKSFAEGNPLGAEQYIQDILDTVISYWDLTDTNEDFPHGYLAGVLSSLNGKKLWRIKSENEGETGRSDIMLSSAKKMEAIVIEVKRTKNPEEMDKLLVEGLRQIEDNRYDAEYKAYHYSVLKYCVCFCGKQVSVKMADPL